MKNFRADGHVLTLIAPLGGVVSGGAYIVGGIFCVALSDADAGDSFVGLVDGVAGLTKASGTTAAAGAAAYFNSTSGLIETADSADNRRIGVFAEAATAGNTNARIRLDGKSFGAGDDDLESKADVAHDHTGATESPITAAAVDSEAATAGQVLVAIGDGTSAWGTQDASKVQLEDAAGHTNETDVEGAIAELYATLEALTPGDVGIESKNVVVALGANSGVTADDPDWVGADVIAIVPVSGADQQIAGRSVDANGAVTVNLAGNSTAEATYRITAILA